VLVPLGGNQFNSDEQLDFGHIIKGTRAPNTNRFCGEVRKAGIKSLKINQSNKNKQLIKVIIVSV
jgi:hypothetical protein